MTQKAKTLVEVCLIAHPDILTVVNQMNSIIKGGQDREDFIEGTPIMFNNLDGIYHTSIFRYQYKSVEGI